MQLNLCNAIADSGSNNVLKYGVLRPAGVKIHTDNVSALAVFRMDKLLFLAYFSTSSLTFTCLQTIFQHTTRAALLPSISTNTSDCGSSQC